MEGLESFIGFLEVFSLLSGLRRTLEAVSNHVFIFAKEAVLALEEEFLVVVITKRDGERAVVIKDDRLAVVIGVGSFMSFTNLAAHTLIIG